MSRQELNRRIANRRRSRSIRMTESAERREVRLSTNAALQRRLRSNETAEEREERLRLDSQRHRQRRAVETEGERDYRLRIDSERHRLRVTEETVEERERRRELNRRQTHESRMNETVLQQDQRRGANREQQEQRRLDVVRRAAERERNAQLQQSLRARETSTERQNRQTIARNAARRRAEQLQSVTIGIGRISEERPVLHCLGRMEVECVNCSAKHFSQEVTVRTVHTFNSCCNFGRINLQPFRNFPDEIRRLFEDQDERSRHFRTWIRNYNNGLAMASMTATIDAPRSGGPYCFRVHGQVYHSTGALRPLPGKPSMFAQIYIFDTESAATELTGRPVNHECRRDVFSLLFEIIQRENIFARSYRMMEEVVREEEERSREEHRPRLSVTMVFDSRASDDRRRYNAATSNEVAAVYKGNDEEIEGERRLVVVERSGQMSFIRDYDPKCDPLTYPLLFPRGEQGWYPGMEKQRVQGRKRSKLTQREYYAYLLFPRDSFFNPILHGGKLMQQFVVDSWVKVEQNRLNFLRQNQSNLRVDTYRGLQDYVIGDELHDGPPGRRIMLPSSYTGSPRDMIAKYQDAMTIVSRYGKPDLFITVTCNPRWSEIQESLFPGQTPSDRPDIVARVFKLKLDEIFHDLFKKHILGEVAAYIWVIEFQKRGLPHAHILIILKERWKPRTSVDVDELISAELPSRETDPVLYEIISKQMIHRPCGVLNPSSPCMIEGQCSKKYPKLFTDETSLDGDGFPNYRRRNDGRFTMCEGVRLDNTSVVPYNPYLSRKYACHINVEACSTITSVKYLYKYVYKGHDRARVRIHQNDQDSNQTNYDEIKAHLDARYVCAPEAMHRLLEYPMQGRSDHVERLPIHLENEQTVAFIAGQEEQAVSIQNDTKLTAWFRLNREYAATRQSANLLLSVDPTQLCYHQIPEYYTWNNRDRRWQPRKNRCRVIGRMYYISPKEVELFAMRLLLLYRKGVTSFADLRTVGHLHNTFADAARAAGYMDDDSYYVISLEEAIGFHMPAELRSYFASLLCFCEVVNPRNLWERYKKDLSEDYLNRGLQSDLAEALAFHDIAGRTALHSVNLKEVLNIEYAAVADATDVLDHEAHKKEGEMQYRKLNEEQKSVVDAVLSAAQDHDNNYFFIDGPGGTGKTFVYNTAYSLLIGMKKRVICVAWSGIAASLLPNGRTVSSTFKLNPVDKDLTSTMKRQSSSAKQLREIDVVIWDEAPMAPKQALEAVDKLLRDIMQTEVPFGNKTMLLGGDFRQVLPVVRKGGRAEMVAACIKNSPLWRHFLVFHLRQNMRVSGSANDWKKYLLDIGDGKLPSDENNEIHIPQELLSRRSLADEIFAPFFNGQSSDLSKMVILTPKNAESLRISNYILERMPGEEFCFRSIDSVITEDPSDMLNMPTEFLNKMTPSGFPPHELRIKTGCIVMLLRNLDLKKGLCNGTRLVVVQGTDRVLGCTFACGSRKGQYVLIPRIDNYYKQDIPFILRRRQFPVRLCFAITINKSQGQTFERVGISLNEKIFSHGQLYVALSRAKCKEGVKIESRDGRMQNIVYPEVLEESSY